MNKVPIPRLLPGILLVAAVAAAGVAAAVAASNLSWTRNLGLGALTLAIGLGIAVGNTLFPRIASHTAAGVDWSRSTLLRLGIILFGLKITFAQIMAVGWAGILIDVIMVTLVFTLSVQLGTRVFGLDRETATLIGAGSAICGAAAVMATEPLTRSPAHKVSVAVATVVVFGTIGMFFYPLVFPYLHVSQHEYGIYAGSTLHEVAQVVAAGKSVGDEAAATGVIEKMIRVMLLAPFLLILSTTRAANGEPKGGQPHGASGKPKIVIPWFAVLFLAMATVHSLHAIPAVIVKPLIAIDTGLLAMAMAALGLRTHVGAIRQAGVKPMLLALTLFAFLMTGGWAVNRAVMHFYSPTQPLPCATKAKSLRVQVPDQEEGATSHRDRCAAATTSPQESLPR